MAQFRNNFLCRSTNPNFYTILIYNFNDIYRWCRGKKKMTVSNKKIEKKILEYNILTQKISVYSDISIFKVVATLAQVSYLNNDIKICRNLKLLHLSF